MCSCDLVDQRAPLDLKDQAAVMKALGVSLIPLQEFVFQHDATCKKMMQRAGRQLLSVVVRKFP